MAGMSVVQIGVVAWRNRMNGKITRLMSDKGYGFIKCTEDGKEYFFHRSDYNGQFDDLCTDVESGHVVDVIFDSVDSPKGPRAGDVIRNDGGI
jgi:cold shock CspA family protein